MTKTNRNFVNIYIINTLKCNVHCEHCFAPKDDKFIEKKQIEKIVNFANTYADNTYINFVFHGGEPTLLPTDTFREYIEYIKNNLKESIEFGFNIQTNLITLNDKLLKLYKDEFNSSIGVSYDIKIRHLKGNISFDKIFFEKLQVLRDNNIQFTTILTVTKHVIDMGAKKFYKFLKSNFPDVHLEKLSKDGEAVDNWNNIGVTNKEYSDFMIELFKLYTLDCNDNTYFNISPFDNICKGFTNDISLSCKGKCSSFYSFGPEGYIGTCTAFGKKLNETDNDKIKQANKKLVFSATAHDNKICLTCEFKDKCKFGCPANGSVLDSSGDCRGASRLLEFIKQHLTKNKNTFYYFKDKTLSIENFMIEDKF